MTTADVTGILRTWARGCTSLADAKIYLFGSLVQDAGNLFHSDASDVDLATVIQDNLPVTQRIALLKAALEAMHTLECQLVIALKRSSADLPIASNVILTSTEAQYSIHKSGDRNLLSFDRFIALTGDSDKAVALSRGGDEANFIAQNSDQLSVIRECQARRNKFVSISVNRTRAVKPFDGLDAIPKDIRRLAAILAWNRGQTSNAKREDLIAGMNFLQTKIDSLPSQDPLCVALTETVALRRNTRESRKPLSEDMVMLLYEILFDEALIQLKPSQRDLIDRFISRLGGMLKRANGRTEQ